MTPRSTRHLGELVNRGYRFALSLTHNAVRAEDLTQDAWFAVLRRRGPWNREYLFKTIRNRFIDQHRRDKRVEVEPLVDDAASDAAPEPPDWNTEQGLAVSNGVFDEVLGRLSADERAVLYLAAVEDYTAQQIADLLDRPRGTVLSMIHRARTKLRNRIEAEPRTTT
ncbi:MAG: RNA polymerase sigma factor [Phycisphaerae bacterium]